MFRQTVLIISSDEGRSRLLCTHLCGAGYGVQISGSGESALKVLRTARPGLVLIDWQLPDLSGTAVIRRLRSDEHTAKLPLILVSSGMREEDRLVGLEAGADLCLEEPFHPREFLARVQALVRRVYG